MSMAWETTVDDVKTVLDAHNVKKSAEEIDQIHDDLDHDAIESMVLTYTNMADQTVAMLCYIEEQLLEKHIVSGPNKFPSPDDDWDLEYDPDEHADMEDHL